MRRVAVLAYDSCWAMSVFSAVDFFHAVALLEQHLRLPPAYVVSVLSVNGAEVRAASGHRLIADDSLNNAVHYDLIVVPAIEGARVRAHEPDAQLLSWLRTQRHTGSQLLAFTTGASLLAAAGVAGDALLATHWAYVRQLKLRYPACQFVAHQAYLQADGLWTTGSLNGGFEALLDMLAVERGDGFSQLCATHLLVADPYQLKPILPGHRNHCDATILRLQDWIESHYAQAPTIAQMAQEVRLTERTLKRRFLLATGVPPNLYAQKVRIDKAKKLLLATPLAIKEIAFEVGYQNVSFFVRLFKQHSGQTPGEWRSALQTVSQTHSR